MQSLALANQTISGVGPSHGMGLRATQILVGYAHIFCLTIALEHVAGRTDCGSKVFLALLLLTLLFLM